MKPNTSRYLATLTGIVACLVLSNGPAYAQTSPTATTPTQTSTGTTTTADTPAVVPGATHRSVRKHKHAVRAPVKPREYPSKPQHAVAKLR